MNSSSRTDGTALAGAAFEDNLFRGQSRDFAVDPSTCSAAKVRAQALSGRAGDQDLDRRAA
ncbi:MAG: hypothetical protein IPH90_03210 [Thermomonas sp.]|nr:hypothetical protein [Thermomonas sp.]